MAMQLEHGCCIATECSWLDERTDLNNIVGTIMINQQNLTCSYMLDHVDRG